ncbi:hypothetical protein CSC82_13120 [Rhodobacteraceae bacterium 4F10]|nr:hypothetical protein CSC82_13120 [Rhodobacteraceae bacterium 4F10]
MSLTDTNPEIEVEVAADAHDDEAISAQGLKMIYAVLAAVVVAWGSAIYAFGVPGLYIPALCAVPVIYLLLIIVARG